MKKSTTILTLLASLITEEEIQTILLHHDYCDVARKFTVSTLLNFFVVAATNEWKSFRHSADVCTSYGLPACNYSTFSKKASAVPFGVFKDIFKLVASRGNRKIRRSFNFPKELLLIDSTTMTVGKTRLPWAPYHGDRAGVKLHVCFSATSQMPQKVVETTGLRHDSPLMDELLDPGYILVADRAYFQIKRVDKFLENRQGFVIRLKTNVQLSKKKALRRLVQPDSNVTADFTCLLGTPQKRTIHRHRIVEFTNYEGKTIRVVTNLMDVSAEKIAAIYQARWGIELFFRWIKQHLNVPTLFGTTENAVFNQLFSALIAYVVLKMFYEETEKCIRQKRLTFLSFTRHLIEGKLSVEWQVAIKKFSRTLLQSGEFGLYKNG